MDWLENLKGTDRYDSSDYPDNLGDSSAAATTIFFGLYSQKSDYITLPDDDWVEFYKYNWDTMRLRVTDITVSTLRISLYTY